MPPFRDASPSGELSFAQNMRGLRLFHVKQSARLKLIDEKNLAAALRHAGLQFRVE